MTPVNPRPAGKIQQDIYHCHSTSRTYAPLETPFSPYFRPSRSLFPLAYENNTVGGDEVLLTVKKGKIIEGGKRGMIEMEGYEISMDENKSTSTFPQFWIPYCHPWTGSHTLAFFSLF